MQRSMQRPARQGQKLWTTGDADAVDTSPVQRVATGDADVVRIAQRMAADSRDFIHFRCRSLERELRADRARRAATDGVGRLARAGLGLVALGGLFLVLAVANGLMGAFDLPPTAAWAVVGSAVMLGGLAGLKLRRLAPVAARPRPRALEDAMEHAPVRVAADLGR